MMLRCRFSARVFVVAAAVAAAMTSIRAQDQQQPPVFRSDVDLIELDVSVLDRQRRPIRGLTLDDFEVFEDGKPQRVVAVSHVDIAEHDPARSARMRYVARDVTANDLSDQLGDGRLVAIVFDDANIPVDSPDIVRGARETARYIVDQLGPSDMAAVVYASNAGRTQDFTSDRQKLLDAIDRFQPAALDWIEPNPTTAGPMSGDLQQWSPTLARSPCMRAEPAVPTLDTVAARLATAPGRRKALMFISVGVPLSLSATDTCGGQLADVMKAMFRKAQRANVNVYGVDPAGPGGYEQYLRFRTAQYGREQLVPGRRRVPRNVRVLQDFMRVLAEQTGGRAVINTNAPEVEIDRILAEDRVYYLLGYESSNGAPDGRFRRVEIRVKRPGASVRSRSGYWAPSAGEVVDRRFDGAPSANDMSMSGLGRVHGVPLRVVAAPMARSAGGANTVDVAAILSVRFPPLRTTATDTLTITRNVYDADGRAGPPARAVESVQLVPGGGDETRHDLFQTLTLAPGRYQLRYQVQSALLGVGGTVFADLDVPDFSRGALTLSGLSLATANEPGISRTGSLETLVPEIPTTRRDFAVGETLSGFVRVYQGAAERQPVSVVVDLFNAGDTLEQQTTRTLDAAAFDQAGAASMAFDIALSGLTPGPHLLSVTARLPSGRTARRDVVIRVR